MNYKGKQNMKKILRALLVMLGLIFSWGNTNVSDNTHFSNIVLSSAPVLAEFEYTLSQPEDISSPNYNSGVFIVANSIEYTTNSTPTTACLSINRSNVTIDLNNQILHCTSPGRTVHGIHVKPGVSNVTIKNGVIRGFTGEGIFIDGSSSSKVTNITIENMTLHSNNTGITGTYVDNATISKTNIRTSTGDTETNNNVAGISFTNSESVHISDSTSIRNKNTRSDKYSYGIRITACKETQVTNCTCNNNQAAGNTTGIYITDTTDNGESDTIANCTCNNNVSTAADAHGIHLETCDFVYVEKCTMKSNKASNGTSYGLKLEGADETTIEENTSVRNNVGFWDNEALGTQTNLYIQNTAYHNVDGANKRDYWRTLSNPIDFTEVSVDNLDAAASASNKSNVSVIIEN